ncbi:hypothetical protein [Dyadobacter sp. CY312]|uniref:hypothetical protein n=1 Tax=Dyadobacter sp. CY312 TaxID=2907303 RepID=UPI001F325098|nr:hypothetical protein [Dyadobacter sp. CY312]MCE7039575.1 hypothetical protein [Dyadobacter sp. CY312]
MNILKQKALSLMESAFAKTGRVIAIRAWEPDSFFEVDVHFPNMDMSGWEKVQHIKIKVGEGLYRDYTPAGWDDETRTCTLYVDAVHEGPGSNWVRLLSVGDAITYVGVGNTFHRAVPGNLIVLGDMSSLAHFLALQQLAHGRQISGAISMAKDGHMVEFFNNFRWKVRPVKQNDIGGFESLLEWTKDQDLTYSEVYIVGHIATSIALRKELKKRKDQPNSIRVQGFWS